MIICSTLSEGAEALARLQLSVSQLAPVGAGRVARVLFSFNTASGAAFQRGSA